MKTTSHLKAYPSLTYSDKDAYPHFS